MIQMNERLLLPFFQIGLIEMSSVPVSLTYEILW